jgi:glutathione reductase (NADPH)
VTLVHRGPLPLTGFDQDLRAVLADEMRKRGIELRLNSTVEMIEKTAPGVRATLMNGEQLDADIVMCATGREPNTRGFGLEAAGVRLAPNGAIVVDEFSKTSVENIYAIGDCTDRVMLTPVAIAEGNAVAETMFGARPMRIDYDNVPSTVFSQPNVGTVGLTEEVARKRFASIDVYKSSFKPLKHTLSGRDEKTFMKLVVDAATDRVLGCHMVGPDAGEIIQGLALALRLGAKKSDFDATIGIHPTAAEEFMTMRQKSADHAAV